MVTSLMPRGHVRPATSEPEPGQRIAAERYSVSVRVGILTGDGQTAGDVCDISVTGARIENVGARPEEGSDLRLGFSFYAHALPVPIHGKVVRHTDDGGFAVEFQDVDFRTQILLRALLPKVCGEGMISESIQVGAAGGLELPPVLLAACAKVAEVRGVSLEEWIFDQLEGAALEGLTE